MDGNLTISYQRARVGVGGRGLVRVPRQVDPVADGMGGALGIAGGLGGGEAPLSIVELRHLLSWPSLALNRAAGVRPRIWAMGCPIHGRMGSDWGYKFIASSSLLKPISWKTDLFAQSSTIFHSSSPSCQSTILWRAYPSFQSCRTTSAWVPTKRTTSFPSTETVVCRTAGRCSLPSIVRP